MRNAFHDLQFEHWQSILLAALPALLNLLIFFYVRIKFPDNKTSKVFSLFLLALVMWQTGDAFVRMSGTEESALYWNYVFSASWIFVMPFGLHFCFLFTGKKKFVETFIVQSLIYGPAAIFLVLTLINKNEYGVLPSSLWGWVEKANDSSLMETEEDWISLQGIFMLVYLLYHAFRLRKENAKRKQAIMIAIGFAFPLIQGTITEIILPQFFHHSSIPLASTFMTFTSVGILIALRKYKLFSISDSLKTRTIIEAMTDTLIVLSSDKKIEFINREGERMLGVNQSEKDNLAIEDFIACKESDPDSFCKKVFSRALAGEKVENFSSELTTRTGNKIPVLISASSYKTGMRDTQVLLLIHDISELIHTEQKLALREEQLKDKTDELNTFFRRTTHDMKGPVASIIGLAQLMKKEPTPEMINSCINHVEGSAARLNNILLDFIKVMQVKERAPEASLIDFPEMTNSIIQSLKFSTGQDTVDFKVAIDSEINFHSDANLLDSILYNLVANAINYRKKHSPENPFVNIHVYTFGNGIMMKVSDNGIGIKKEIQNKIFNLFFRGDTNSKGTGLGLSILKNAIAKLNGRVELESEFNKGTTFIVYLPDLKFSGETAQLGLSSCS